MTPTSGTPATAKTSLTDRFRIITLKRLASPAWAVLEYGWYPAILLVTTPWFLHRLGTGNYGYWMLLTATTGIGAAVNAGTGVATVKAVSGRIGRRAPIQDAVRTSFGFAIIGGAALAIIVLGVFFMGGNALLGRMGSNTDLVRMTGIAAAFLIWIEQIDNATSSALKGAELFGNAARLDITGKGTQIALAVLATWVSPTMASLYTALAVGAAFRLYIKLSATRRLLCIGNLFPSFKAANELLHYARWGWTQGVGSILFGVADRILVGSLLGAASLTYYSIASQAAMQIHSACAATFSVIFPAITRKIESGDNVPLGRITAATTALNVFLASALASILLFFGTSLLNFWLGAAQAGPVSKILPYLTVAYWMLAINVTPHFLLLSTGKIKFLAITNLIAGSALVIAIAMVATYHGLVGVATARTIYGALILVNFIPLIRQSIRKVEQ